MATRPHRRHADPPALRPGPPPARKHLRMVPRGRSDTVQRIGLRTSWWHDVYHEMNTISWGRFLLLAVVIYLLANVLFAALYLLQPGSIDQARPGNFGDAFFFSVQTMSTIGYGKLTPATVYANLLVTAEAVIGILVVALATGLVFARFSRPTARCCSAATPSSASTTVRRCCRSGWLTSDATRSCRLKSHCRYCAPSHGWKAARCAAFTR